MFPPAFVANWRQLNLIKIAIICGSVFVFGILFGYAFFPSMLKKMVGKVNHQTRKLYRKDVNCRLLCQLQNIGLKPGSEIREMYATVPFPLTVKIYLFNVKNPNEVTKGAAPLLEEVGPYVFE